MNKIETTTRQTRSQTFEWMPTANAKATRAADLLGRVRGEFLEMPGLALTTDQARRLWGLDAQTCHGVLHALIDARFLARTADGRYRRLEP